MPCVLLLSTGTSPGNDMKMAATRLESSRNFANKIWNASRFVIKSLEPESERFNSDKQITCQWKTAGF